VKHAFHRIFFTEFLIKALCDSCGKEVAVYESDPGCPGCQASGGRWRAGGRCRHGPPTLPEGSELEQLITRARRKGPGSSLGKASVKVRVTCGSPPPP
jgi:hypothetical protein